MAWAYPQKENALKFLLIRQEWKCASCAHDYSPTLTQIMQKMNIRGEVVKTFADLPWYCFKWLKSREVRARRPEVDHIIPIYKGGQSLGLDNHQAICYTCHKEKTSKDLKK
jgi:5-methylcytosine-specific restriction endonuclease McrA